MVENMENEFIDASFVFVVVETEKCLILNISQMMESLEGSGDHWSLTLLVEGTDNKDSHKG